MERLLGKFDYVEVRTAEDAHAVVINIDKQKLTIGINDLFKLNSAVTRACNALLGDKLR